MLVRLFLLMFGVTLLELYLLIGLYRLTSIWGTVGLVLATAALGSFLLRRQGLRTWKKFQEELARGEVPTNQILDGLIILAGGLLLLTPGVLSDLAGLALMIPGNRRFLREALKRRYSGRFAVSMRRD